MENQMDLTTQSKAPVSFNFFDKDQFATMQRVAKTFASSELVPDMYRINGKGNTENKAIANCMIAISMSMRMDADPLMVMQNMIIIYGRPSWSSTFLIATVNSCGKFKPLKYKFTDKGNAGMVDYTDYVWNPSTRRKEAKTKQFNGKNIKNVECIAYTSPKDSDDVLKSAPISIEMAIKEGWYTKSGSKWQTMPRQMLMYRAASFWTRAYAPELSMGMKTVDEVQDILDIDYEDVKEEEQKGNETVSFNKEPEESTPESAEKKSDPESKTQEPKTEKDKEQSTTKGNEPKPKDDLFGDNDKPPMPGF